MSRTALAFVLLPCLFLVALVATYVLGMLVPSRVIGSGVDSFEGAERAYAKEAFDRVRLDYVSGSGRAFLVSTLHITDVEACPDDDPHPGYLKVSAEFETYTIFGLRYDAFGIGCGGEGLLVRKHPDG